MLKEKLLAGRVVREKADAGNAADIRGLCHMPFCMSRVQKAINKLKNKLKNKRLKRIFFKEGCTVTILFVRSGNTCRSPMAMALFRLKGTAVGARG